MREIKIRFDEAHYKMLSNLAEADEREIEAFIEFSIAKMLRRSVTDYEKAYAQYKRQTTRAKS